MTVQHRGGRDEEKGKGESPLGLEAGLARAPVLPSKSGASEVTILLRAGAALKPGLLEHLQRNLASLESIQTTVVIIVWLNVTVTCIHSF